MVILAAVFAELWITTKFGLQSNFSYRVIWSDPNLRSSYENPVFCDTKFEGWDVVSTRGSHPSGFVVADGMGLLYANFSGVPTYVQVGKSIDAVSTTIYPYISITHREDTSDGGINFSFGIIDEEDVFHDGGWYHVSSNWRTLDFDLRRIYNGTITKIYLRLTNDFNLNYSGGIKHAYVKSVVVCQDIPEILDQYAPDWKLATDGLADAHLSLLDHVLSVINSNSSPVNSLAAAQQVGNFDFDLLSVGFLKVSIRTSSVAVAARIVIWTNDNQNHELLLKTYDDDQWHTEIIQLGAFSVSGSQVVMLQLGSKIIEPTIEPTAVSYKDLSFVSWLPE